MHDGASTTRRRFASALALVLAACAAPGSDSLDASTQGPCELLAERCHPIDTGSGPVHDCHAFAESPATTSAMCAARFDACSRTCTPTDASAGD